MSPTDIVMFSENGAKYYHIKQVRRFVHVEWGWYRKGEFAIKGTRCTDFPNNKIADDYFNKKLFSKAMHGYK